MFNEVCECNEYVFKFSETEADKKVVCPKCGREYSIYVDLDENNHPTAELMPINTLLID